MTIWILKFKKSKSKFLVAILNGNYWITGNLGTSAAVLTGGHVLINVINY